MFREAYLKYQSEANTFGPELTVAYRIKTLKCDGPLFIAVLLGIYITCFNVRGM